MLRHYRDSMSSLTQLFVGIFYGHCQNQDRFFKGGLNF